MVSSDKLPKPKASHITFIIDSTPIRKAFSARLRSLTYAFLHAILVLFSRDSERPKIIIVIKNNIDGDGDENDDDKIVYDDTDHGDCTTKTNNHDNENTDGSA